MLYSSVMIIITLIPTLKLSVEAGYCVRIREEIKLQIISNVKQFDWNVMFENKLWRAPLNQSAFSNFAWYMIHHVIHKIEHFHLQGTLLHQHLDRKGVESNYQSECFK